MRSRHESKAQGRKDEGPNGIAARAAMWSTRHRTLAIGGWLLLVVVVTLVGASLGTVSAVDSDFAHGESGRADRIIAETGLTKQAGEVVLIESRTATADDPGFQAAIAEVRAAVEGTGAVEPLDPAVPAVVSADRHSALVSFTITGEIDTAEERVGPVLDAVAAVQRAHPDLYIAQAGDASGGKQIGEELESSLNRLSLLSIPLTLGILLVAFGALVAALIPVGLAVTAVIAAAGLLAFASRAAPAVDETMHVMLLIGLAIGVDYCLFYIRREREERARGADPHRALAVAAQTSGRSVWISGLTVIVAMSGMFLTRDTVFVSFAIGTVLVVFTAMLGSLTVLPALLSTLGDRVDKGKVPGLYRRRSTGWAWPAILAVVLRRPLVSALVAAVALGLLAAPALRLRTQAQSIDDLPADMSVVQAMKRAAKAFPGGPDPARVVLKATDVTAPGVTAAIADFRASAIATGHLHEPIRVETSEDKTVAVISVGLSGNGTDAASERALDLLRGTVVPATLRGAPGATDVAVTGSTAVSHDYNEALSRSLPLVLGFVLGLAFLLLLVSFRSLVIAVTSIALNLVSLAAAYGMLVLVFQDALGGAGITNWLPMFLFVILFGLSMDYHVFVLSRIREGHDRGLTTKQAVATGITSTAGAISSAAVVMVAVFALFATIPLASTRQLGLGLAAAILLDATIIRAVLLPSMMVLLGERNWYLPRWLGWLPRISHGTSEPVAATQPSAEPRAVTVGAGGTGAVSTSSTSSVSCG